MAKPDHLTYHLNPAWLTRFAPSVPDDVTALTGRDMAIVMEVACQLSAATPFGADFESFVEQELRDHAEGKLIGGWCDVRLRNDAFRKDFGFRTTSEVETTLRRLAQATMGGQPMFRSVTYEPPTKTTSFVLAPNNAMVGSHIAFASKRATTRSKAHSHYPFPERVFARVRPGVMTRWSSSASVPLAARLIAWMTTPCRDGLPPGRYELDRDRLVLRLRFEDVASALGINLAVGRRIPARFDEVLARVRQDLRDAPFVIDWSWARKGRIVDGFALRATIPKFQEQFHALPDARGRPDLARGALPRFTSGVVDEGPVSEVTVNEPIPRPKTVMVSVATEPVETTIVMPREPILKTEPIVETVDTTPEPVADVVEPVMVADVIDDTSPVTSLDENADEQDDDSVPIGLPEFDTEKSFDDYAQEELDSLSDDQVEALMEADRLRPYVPPMTSAERRRREWREEQGLRADDTSHDEDLPAYLADD